MFITFWDHTAAAAKSLQSCPTLCDPTDGSPPGSPVPGILQARTLEWVAISFSNAWKWKRKVKSLSRVQLLATPWTAAHHAPPSMGFSKQEYWSGVPLPIVYSWWFRYSLRQPRLSVVLLNSFVSLSNRFVSIHIATKHLFKELWTFSIMFIKFFQSLLTAVFKASFTFLGICYNTIHFWYQNLYCLFISIIVITTNLGDYNNTTSSHNSVIQKLSGLCIKIKVTANIRSCMKAPGDHPFLSSLEFFAEFSALWLGCRT